MKVCGLTGGVGMGKSTAAGFFSQYGVRVVDTDQIARDLVLSGQPALLEIQDQFGRDLVSSGGELKRHELARLVFADETARKQLEAILHPRIRERWLAQIEDWRSQNHPLAIVVIPLLFETGAEKSFDRIICVACSPASQRQRLLERGWDTGQINQRIAAQFPAELKMARSDFVIWTEGLPEVHQQQVARIVEKL